MFAITSINLEDNLILSTDEVLQYVLNNISDIIEIKNLDFATEKEHLKLKINKIQYL